MKSLFIDGSYFIFYRFFATLNWFKHKHDDIDKSNITKNAEFMEKYSKMFEKTLKDIVRIYGIEWKNVYFAKDCPREEIWRNSLIDAYKATRVTHALFDGEIFKYTYRDLIPNLINSLSFQMIHGEGLEADDVIALSISVAKADDECFIITNDNDYIQLLNHNNRKIHILNLQHQDISLRNAFGDDVGKFLLVKIIQGDKSDNIPSIGKKIGPQTALKLASDPNELAKYFEKNPVAKNRYDLNRRLIDFQYIDEECKRKFLESINCRVADLIP